MQKRRLAEEMNWQRLERLRRGRHDCMRDCEHPSQCHDERSKARLEEVEEETEGEDTVMAGSETEGEDEESKGVGKAEK